MHITKLQKLMLLCCLLACTFTHGAQQSQREKRKREATDDLIRQRNGSLFSKSASEELLSAVKSLDRLKVANAIENGADVNYVSITKKTPLFLAIERGCTPVITLLVEQENLNINTVDSAGETALHAAVKYDTQHGFNKITPLLLNNKNHIIDPNIHTKTNFTPLDLAVYKDNLATIGLLCRYKHTNIDIQDKNGLTALMLAAMRNYADSAEMLIGYGANHAIINKKNNKTAAHYAQYSNEIKKILANETMRNDCKEAARPAIIQSITQGTARQNLFATLKNRESGKHTPLHAKAPAKIASPESEDYLFDMMMNFEEKSS